MASASASGVVWMFGKVFPVQKCSHQRGSGKAVKRAGEDVKGVYTRREPMRMLLAVVFVFLLLARGS